MGNIFGEVAPRRIDGCLRLCMERVYEGPKIINPKI